MDTAIWSLFTRATMGPTPHSEAQPPRTPGLSSTIPVPVGASHRYPSARMAVTGYHLASIKYVYCCPSFCMLHLTNTNVSFPNMYSFTSSFPSANRCSRNKAWVPSVPYQGQKNRVPSSKRAHKCHRLQPGSKLRHLRRRSLRRRERKRLPSRSGCASSRLSASIASR